uniref:Casein kinase substrate, phosphoprotein PP28 n=1 Tax=Bursaphelenchus xylophilus TaxID=6326 RepID=A0A1I7RXS5_BURXY
MKQVVVHTVGGHSGGGRGKRGGWRNRRGTFRSRQWRDGSRSSVPAISGAITDVVPIPISPPNEVNQVENEKINSDFTAQDVDQSECQTPPHIADEPDIAFVEADVVLGDPKINGPVVAEEDTVMSHEPPLNALELSKKRDQENADAAIRAKIRRLERQLQKSHENQENLRQQLQEEQERRERRDQRKAEKRRLRELQLEQLNEPKKKNVVTLREEIKKKMPQRKVD